MTLFGGVRKAVARSVPGAYRAQIRIVCSIPRSIFEFSRQEAFGYIMSLVRRAGLSSARLLLSDDQAYAIISNILRHESTLTVSLLR